MFALTDLFLWLIQGFLLSTGIIATGCLLAKWCRPKSVRYRILQWTLYGTVVGLVLIAVPNNWRYTVALNVLPHDVPHEPDRMHAGHEDPAQVAERSPIDDQFAARVPIETTKSPMPTSESQGGVVDLSPSLATPAPAIVSENASSPFDWKAAGQNTIAGLFLLGCWAVLGRWCLARLQLHRLYLRSREAPASVRAQLQDVAGCQSLRVRLRVSSEIVSPITWGVFSPIIMVPESIIDQEETQPLRFSLAHEWAHVAAHDSTTWLIVNALQGALYYHPLYWWLRRRLLLTMDQLADAQAATNGESPADYAAFLVQLARARQHASPRLALAVSDSHSMLRKRVEFLIENNPLAQMTCSTVQHALIAIAAMLLVLIGSAIKLQPKTGLSAQEPPTADAKPVPVQPPAAKPDENAAKPDDSTDVNALKEASDAALRLASQFVSGTKPSIGELLKAVVQERPDGSIVYYGFVIDHETDLPIMGAKVQVHHKLSNDPKTGKWSTIEVTDHQTNLLGMYSFTLPPEQVAQSSLYIEVEAHHPKYASMGRSGYSHDMIRKNLKLGELPFYTEIKLWPGTPIEGTLVAPDGQPVEGVEVSMYAQSSKISGMLRGSWGKVTSDKQGRFRIVPPTPGDGVLWIKPDKYAPQAYRLENRRGDWGQITLTGGADVPGQILDIDGKPIHNLRIEARRRGDGEKADEYLEANAIANGIGRRATSDDNGRFTLSALPDGDYSVTVEANIDSYDRTPLEQVFMAPSFKVEQGRAEPLTIRALPHVVLQGTYLDSQNRPRGGSEIMLFGRLGEKYYYTRSNRPGKDGKFEMRLPHGLREISLDLITNEHSALKWRKSRDQPLQRGRTVKFSIAEDDIRGFEVVRYTAPIVLVKAVDTNGNVVADVEPMIQYLRPSSDEEELSTYVGGSQVSFEKQGDGRHRTSQLLPDEAISVTVKKAGFTTVARELKLAEGEEQEVQFVLVPEEKKAGEQ